MQFFGERIREFLGKNEGPPSIFAPLRKSRVFKNAAPREKPEKTSVSVSKKLHQSSLLIVAQRSKDILLPLANFSGTFRL